jgi:hypothetical protein
MNKYLILKQLLLNNSKGLLPAGLPLVESDLIENSCHYFALLCHFTFGDSLYYASNPTDSLYYGGHAFLKNSSNQYFDARLHLFSSTSDLLGDNHDQNSLVPLSSDRLCANLSVSRSELSQIKTISKLYLNSRP